MRNSNSLSNEMNGRFIIVDESIIKELIDNQREILSAIRDKEPANIMVGNYINESEAKKMLNRKTTWFYNLRKEGKLAYTKVGSQTFYKLKDIENLLELNQQQPHK
jgi:hypothetical protein